MRSKRNLVRFLALLMATAMIVAVLLMVAMPYAGAPSGATLAEAIPVVLIVAAFLVVCAWALSKGVAPMAPRARGKPLASGVSMGDQVNMKDQRRHWARRYPSGFPSCHLTPKRDASEPVVTKLNPHMKLSTDVPLLAESGSSGMTTGLLTRATDQLRVWMKRRYHDSVFGTFAYGVAV